MLQCCILQSTDRFDATDDILFTSRVDVIELLKLFNTRMFSFLQFRSDPLTPTFSFFDLMIMPDGFCTLGVLFSKAVFATNNVMIERKGAKCGVVKG